MSESRLRKAAQAVLDDVVSYGLAHPEGGRFECEHADALSTALAADPEPDGEPNGYYCACGFAWVGGPDLWPAAEDLHRDECEEHLSPFFAAPPETVPKAILTRLLDQLNALGIPDWNGAEGLDLREAQAAIGEDVAVPCCDTVPLAQHEELKIEFERLVRDYYEARGELRKMQEAGTVPREVAERMAEAAADLLHEDAAPTGDGSVGREQNRLNWDTAYRGLSQALDAYRAQVKP